MWIDQFLPVKQKTPMNPNHPVVISWMEGGQERKSKQPNITVARKVALQIIGQDDRVVVKIVDSKTKEPRGRVGLICGQPYWKYQRTTYSLRRDGTVIKDLYNFY